MPRNANNVDNKLSNYSIEFDGGTSSQAIDCGNGSDVDITGPISISVWFNATTVDNARGIVCKNDAAAQQTFAQYFFDLLSGEIRWRAGASTVTHAISADQWYHAVGVYDGSNTTLYIDGAQVATAAASTSSYQSNQPMYIGRRLNQSYFGGKIAQVCIFDYALTDGTGGTTNQIGYLYNLNNPMAITGGEPVAYWPLGDNSNPNANAGYPNISVGADSVFDFDGDKIEPSATLTELGISNEFSVSVWANADTITNFRGPLGAVNNAWTTGFGMYINASKWVFFVDHYNTSKVTSDTTITTDTWFHLVGTFSSSGTGKLYVNGIKEGTDITGVTLDGLSNNFGIGSLQGGGGPFQGKITNVEIWNKELIASEVTTLYNNGQPLMTGTQPQAASLKGWWKLNQSANWEADSAGNWQIPDARSAYPQSFDFGNKNEDEYIELPQLPSFTSIAVSAWIKTQKSNTRQTIIGNNGQITAERGWDLRLGGVWTGGYEQAEFQFYNSDGSSNIALEQTLSKSLADNKWHHVVAIWDGTTDTNAAKIFVDGLLGGQNTSSFAGPISQPPATFEPRIGERGFSSSGGGGGWNFGGDPNEDGFISNVQIWNTSLTYGTVSSIGDLAGEQIAELYNNGVPLTSAIATDNLKVWYKLDNTATFSTNWSIPDASGNSNTGTSSGMTEQNLANNNVSVFNGESNGMNSNSLVQSNLTRKQPYSNYSIDFDSGDATYMQVPDPGSSVLAYGEDKFSFSGWINPTTFVDQGGLIARYKGANNRTTIKGTYANGFDGLMFQSIDIPTTANFHIRWENILSTNEWQHVCFIYDGAGPSCTLYINGVDQGAGVLTGSIPSSLPNFNGYPIDIGVDAMNGLGNRNYDGKFSNFAIFNSILSIDDVLNLYNNGVSQDLNNFRITPIAWWPMDQSYTYYGTDLVARDVISSNDGTGTNLIQEDIVGNAPGSEANGTASNIAIADLEGNMKDSDKNAYSINMSDYASGTNPANSGRSTSVPFP